MNKKNLMLLVLICLTLLVIGCSTKTKLNNTSTNMESDQVRKYADPMAQSILEAMNEKNYEKFSKDFAVVMKESLDSKSFDLLSKDFDKRIGVFQALSFSSIEKQQKYTIVVYNAKYTNEPKGVIVRVVFEQDNNSNLVSGLYFDSPNLREK